MGIRITASRLQGTVAFLPILLMLNELHAPHLGDPAGDQQQLLEVGAGAAVEVAATHTPSHYPSVAIGS